METVHLRAWGYYNDFSEQLLVDCAKPPNEGCDGGMTWAGIDYVVKNGLTQLFVPR